MARPREFDIDEALGKAMGVFWIHGYECASLPMLLEGMGLTRGSLYKAFADKKSLYLAALERYEAKAVAPAVALLTNEEIEDGLLRITQLFESVVEAVRSGDRRGCLLCSAAAGRSVDDPDMANVIHALLAQMQRGFEGALEASRVHAELSPKTRTDLSVLLLTHYIGVRILSSSRAPLELIEQSTSSLADMLDCN